MSNLVKQEVREIRVVNSHTGGEPTRVIMGGGPDLGVGTLAEMRSVFKRDFDHFRSAVVNEPRGSDAYVGALYMEPKDDTTIGGVIFFNNVGYLGMCVHGTIGLIQTLLHLGRLAPADHVLGTPEGNVAVTLAEDGTVSVTNVPSYRTHKDVKVDVPGIGVVTGDIAWGGNWFFLCDDHGQSLDPTQADELTEYAWKVRKALNAQGHPVVDHVELFGPPISESAHGRSFVLCPGKAYDRSPCGTGTSACTRSARLKSKAESAALSCTITSSCSYGTASAST